MVPMPLPLIAAALAGLGGGTGLTKMALGGAGEVDSPTKRTPTDDTAAGTHVRVLTARSRDIAPKSPPIKVITASPQRWQGANTTVAVVVFASP